MIDLPNDLVLKGVENAWLCQYTLIDDDFASGFECGHNVAQKLDDILVGPVVQNGAEHIDGCSFHGLWVLHVVSHKLDATGELRGAHPLAFGSIVG